MHTSRREEEVKIITVSSQSKPSRTCAGGCGGNGQWRVATRTYVCKVCRLSRPHALITRGRAMAESGLSYERLKALVEQGRLAEMRVPNFRKGAPPVHLYYIHELEQVCGKRISTSSSRDPDTKIIELSG